MTIKTYKFEELDDDIQEKLWQKESQSRYEYYDERMWEDIVDNFATDLLEKYGAVFSVLTVRSLDIDERNSGKRKRYIVNWSLNPNECSFAAHIRDNKKFFEEAGIDHKHPVDLYSIVIRESAGWRSSRMVCDVELDDAAFPWKVNYSFWKKDGFKWVHMFDDDEHLFNNTPEFSNQDVENTAQVLLAVNLEIADVERITPIESSAAESVFGSNSCVIAVDFGTDNEVEYAVEYTFYGQDASGDDSEAVAEEVLSWAQDRAFELLSNIESDIEYQTSEETSREYLIDQDLDYDENGRTV